MSFSRADELALRRRLLVVDAAIQRLRLSQELATVGESARPTTLLRQAWLNRPSRPLFFVLPVLATLILRRAGVRGVMRQAIRALRVWRDLRQIFKT